MKLVIGSKNSSSWSLRPWLLLKQVGLPFEEVVVPLRRPDSEARLRAVSPSGKVPVLVAGEVKVWDSLAICEFLAEHDPSLWPADSAARAVARSISAEMHSGFPALRTFLPMDFVARFGPPGKLLTSVRTDIERVLAIWTECRRLHGQGGPFLFGAFSVADAMFAPVCSRFATYAIPLDPVSAAYVERVMGLPAMQEWGRGAAAEVAGVPYYPRPEEAAAPAATAAPTAAAAPPRPPAPPMPQPEPLPARLPATFAPRVVLAEGLGPGDPTPPTLPPRAPEAPPPPPAPEPARVQPPPSPRDVPEEIRRALRPIPSTVMVKPIGDGTRRRR